MLTFNEFLAEAEKKQTFRQFVMEIFNKLKTIPNYHPQDSKPHFTSVKEQMAEFSFYDSDYDKFRFDADTDKLIKEFEEWHKKVANLLGLTSKPKMSRKSRDYNQTYTYEETLPNGYKIKYVSGRSYSYNQTIDEFTIIGKASKTGDTEFTTFPEYKPGTILYTSSGYDMTRLSFYQIIKRSGNAIYVQEIGQKVVSGHGGYSGEAVPTKDKFIKGSKTLSARLPNVKIEGDYAHLWDGKPKWFNYMD